MCEMHALPEWAMWSFARAFSSVMSGRVAPEPVEGAAEPLDDATESIISAEQGGYGDAPASAVAINKSIAEGRWEYGASARPDVGARRDGAVSPHHAMCDSHCHARHAHRGPVGGPAGAVAATSDRTAPLRR